MQRQQGYVNKTGKWVSMDTVCSLVQGQGLHSQFVCAAAMHEKQDNLMIIWDKVFNILPNFYYQNTQHLGLICFFLKIPKRMVIT